MDSGVQRAAVIGAIVLVFLTGAAVAITRPAPRHDLPLLIDDAGIERETVVLDRKGRPIISNVRTVEKGVLYRGSGWPLTFESGGTKEFADETAFEFLRALNVRHVVALVDSADTYYAEDGYLKYWSNERGYPITTTWVQIDPTGAFGRDDRGGLHAAGILIALMREQAGRGGAVYVHDIDGIEHVGVAAAGYELWRNRGWNDFDTTWTLVERRFLAGNRTMLDLQRTGRSPEPKTCPSGQRAFVCREWLRGLREDLRFIIEL
jgi:hypothetical protein